MTMTMISPFSGAPEQQDLIPSEGIRSFAAAATSDSLVKIRTSLSGRDGDLVKKPQARKCPRLHLVGPTRSGNLAAWAHPFGPRGLPRLLLLPFGVLPKKNQLCNFLFINWAFVAPETIKTRRRRFSASQKLNTKNRDFVGKSPKSSKTCKNNDIVMQITF